MQIVIDFINKEKNIIQSYITDKKEKLEESKILVKELTKSISDLEEELVSLNKTLEKLR